MAVALVTNDGAVRRAEAAFSILVRELAAATDVGAPLGGRG